MTFSAVIMAFGGAYSILTDLYLRDRSRIIQRVDGEFRSRQRERAKKSLMFKDLRDVRLDPGELAEKTPTLRQRFEAMVEQSGLDLTPERLQVIVGLSGVGAGAVLGLFRQSVFSGVVGA